jgi:malate dehydrogenase
MGIPSTGDYGAPEGIITSFPCTTSNGVYSVVSGLDLDEFSKVRIEASWAELVEERDAVSEMGLLG